jgi:TFIIF-interacting CTD phosphatase-like protein
MKKSDKLIVLDIDETLFYCDYTRYVDEPNYTFVLKNGKRSESYSTIKRPHVDKFLNYIKTDFEYGIYTAASRDYAEEHMKHLNLNPKFILANENCTPKLKYEEGDWAASTYYLKSLSKLKKYADISKMIAIDDKWESYTRNYGNLIKVPPFTGDRSDNTLLKLINFLEDLKDVNNVREVEKRGWIDKY